MTPTVSPASHQDATSSSTSAAEMGQEASQAYRFALSQFAGVISTDLQGKIVEVNEYFCGLLGYESSELIGQSYSKFASHLQSETDAQRLWDAIAAHQPWQGEIRHCASNGNHHWLETSVIPIKTAQGKVHRYLFVGRDITQERQWKKREKLQQDKLAEQRANNKTLKIRLDGNNDILHLIVNGAPLAKSLTAIAKLTERLASNLHCAIMVVDPMSGHLIHHAAPSLHPVFIETMDDLPITPQGGALAAAAHGQCTIVVPDIAADTHAHYVNDVALQHGLRACWACPILVRQQVVAVIGIYYSQPQYPSETDQRLMARAVELAQVAMERHRSATALHSKLEQTLLLGQITREIRQSLDIKEVFQTAVTQLRRLLRADRVVIAQFMPPPGEEAEGQAESLAHRCTALQNRFIAEDVLKPFLSILGLPLTGPCSEPKEGQNALEKSPDSNAVPPSPLSLNPKDPTAPVLVEDIYYAGLKDGDIAILEALEIQASISVPIMGSDDNSEDGCPWGMLSIQQCSTPRQWQESEISFVKALTEQLSVAIQQADLLSQARQKSEHLQDLLKTVKRQKQQQSRIAERERVVSRVIQQIHKTREINKILATTTQEARNLLRCDRVLIYRFLPDWHREIAHESFSPALSPFQQTPAVHNWADQHLRQTQGGRYRNGESAVVEDIYESDYSDEHIQCFAQKEIRAFIVVPIFVGDQLWGLMGAYQHHQPHNWKFEDLSCLERIAGQLGVAFQQAELLKQLKTAKDKADSANQAKGTFLANMSHELRTPLNAILGFSQLMQRDPSSTPEQQKTLNIINRSGTHLLSLINDVLDMSKIEAGNMVLNEDEIDLHGLCDSVYEMFRLKASSKGLTFKVERDAAIPQYIYSDERKLRQILMNLLSNSLKFTSHGSIILKLWKGKSVQLDPMVSLSNAPVELWFSVSDTGQGIAPEEMGQLFDAFAQTESGRLAQEGTGLGLPISREFVQMMGGNLTLDSQLHQGTTAQFSVVVPPVVGKRASSPKHQRVCSIAPGQPDYRLLVVEDRLENRILLTRLLECVGFSVRTANNGEEAIAQWQDWKPHLIWMDLQMPVMDGFEATRKIRILESEQHQPSCTDALPTEKSTPPPERETYILAITASAFEETRTLTLEGGFDDFIRKPFQESLIFEKITQYLGTEYCYEALDVAMPSPQEAFSQADNVTGLQQQCQAMGQTWQESIHQAAVDLDEATVQRHIDALGEKQTPLKTQLQQWFQTLRLDKIAELTQAPPLQNSA